MTDRPPPFNVAVMGACKLRAGCEPKHLTDCLDEVAEKAREFLSDPTRRVQFRAAVLRSMTTQRDALIDLVKEAMEMGGDVCAWCGELTLEGHKRDCRAMTMIEAIKR